MDHEGETGQIQAPHWSVGVYEWVVDRLPESRRARIILAGIGAAFVISLSVSLLILPIWVDMSEDRFATLGLFGVFIANLASTSTVFIPVPGLTVAAQALIISQGAAQNFVLVGVIGGVGMGLGEITAYVAGAAGSQVARDGNVQAPRLIRPFVERVIYAVDWLMKRYGFLTLFVLSAIPNPTFELAGIAAGAVRMLFLKFLVAVIGGSVLRGLVLAFAGDQGLNIPIFT